MILAHLAVLLLVVVSLGEVLETIASIGHRLAGRPDAIVIGNLAATLLPAGAVLFWGGKAITVQAFRLITRFAGCSRRGSAIPHRGAAARRADGVGTGFWVGAAFFAALGLAGTVLVSKGTDTHSIGESLQYTGRLSFLFFWPAYAGSAIATLFGPRFCLLRNRGREFGLAYAAAQLVHFSLVIWLIGISHQPVETGLMPFFLVGILWTYLLAFSSIAPARRVFDAQFWGILRNTGMQYICLVFFSDFVLDAMQNGVEHSLFYLPFATLTIVGPFLRVAAIATRIVQRSGVSHA